MIEFGLACLLVCALSILDRKAMPFAVTLSAGWIAGFAGSQWWPFISIASGCILICLLDHRSPCWAWIVAACVPVMLLCDVAYLWALANGNYLGAEYAAVLNLLFSVQLAACGWPGGLRGLRISRYKLRCWGNQWDRANAGNRPRQGHQDTD